MKVSTKVEQQPKPVEIKELLQEEKVEQLQRKREMIQEEFEAAQEQLDEVEAALEALGAESDPDKKAELEAELEMIQSTMNSIEQDLAGLPAGGEDLIGLDEAAVEKVVEAGKSETVVERPKKQERHDAVVVQTLLEKITNGFEGDKKKAMEHFLDGVVGGYSLTQETPPIITMLDSSALEKLQETGEAFLKTLDEKKDSQFFRFIQRQLKEIQQKGELFLGLNNTEGKRAYGQGILDKYLHGKPGDGLRELADLRALCSEYKQPQIFDETLQGIGPQLLEIAREKATESGLPLVTGYKSSFTFLSGFVLDLERVCPEVAEEMHKEIWRFTQEQCQGKKPQELIRYNEKNTFGINIEGIPLDAGVLTKSLSYVFNRIKNDEPLSPEISAGLQVALPFLEEYDRKLEARFGNAANLGYIGKGGVEESLRRRDPDGKAPDPEVVAKVKSFLALLK